MLWLPWLSPLYYVILLPLAAVFYFYPNTTYTLPSMFPMTDPDYYYTWFIVKTLYFGGYAMEVASFLGIPLDALPFYYFSKYVGYETTITSEECAAILAFFLMALPFIMPFAIANYFYIFFLMPFYEF